MPDTLTLLQFQSPWQGRHGFRKFSLDTDTGALSQIGQVKAHKLLRKGKGGLDGLILQPTWPSRRKLCVLTTHDTLHLHEVTDDRVDWTRDPIDVLDPAFRSVSRERLLFRTFILSDGRRQIGYSDMEGRLLGPRRTAFDIFPTRDFSPFAQLIRMLGNPGQRDRLISDLKEHRLDYPRWVEPKHRASPSTHITAQ